MRKIKPHTQTKTKKKKRHCPSVFNSPISMRFGKFHGQKGAMRMKVKAIKKNIKTMSVKNFIIYVY